MSLHYWSLCAASSYGASEHVSTSLYRVIVGWTHTGETHRRVTKGYKANLAARVGCRGWIKRTGMAGIARKVAVVRECTPDEFSNGVVPIPLEELLLRH
ncbi:hypothetical protein BS17DRAFT_785336 [Gyrodon lividus]|nr:hypothetical protein BS17DRAFT_785336 [Gyrodon lividus]